MLSIGARLTEDDLSSLVTALGAGAIDHDALTVAFHAYLLNVGGELGQRLAVRQQGVGVEAVECGIPVRKQTHQDGNVLVERSSGEVVVNVPHTSQKLRNHVETVVQGKGQHTDSTGHTEPTSDPIPETESVLGVNSEFLNLGQSGTHGNHMAWNGRHPKLLHDVSLDSAGVKHGLSGGEGLGHDDEQSLFRVQAREGTARILRVNVGQEMQLASRASLLGWLVGLQSGVNKQRAQETTTDTDGNDVLH
mmetsp:Transcript_91575/g.158787  ORF Transcript_91575/g.158787 Transcript_91575/m.158787 type:complete len:249 (-) Transcript_91575:439-1185(-)